VEKRFKSSLKTKGEILDKIKTFLAAFGTAILTIALFFFRRKGETRTQEVSKVQVEKEKAEMKLKELEVKRELEKKYEGLSDADIVQRAINEKLGSADESQSKGDKGSR
jgi:hypothetical protein